jgi:nitrite reductase/ring-hydroxylating ferredoxin subunit
MTDSERLDRALDDLLAGRSPHAKSPELDEQEQHMLRVAQLLRGRAGDSPDPTFVDSLHGRLYQQSQRPSRRIVVLGAIATLAAGLVGGIGLDRLASPGSNGPARTALVGPNGRWITVAASTDFPHGGIKPFTAGNVQGFLIKQHGEFRALSRVCTHMGCTLDFKAEERAFVCPCHGAEFSLSGQIRDGPHGYALRLAPLPQITVRQRNGAIQVWAV